MIAFPFFRSMFANISPTFLISWQVQTVLTILKYSEQYIRDHLSGTKVRTWIGFECETVFNFSCIASCNLTKTVAFFCMSFLSKESDSKLFKQFTCTFYASEKLLCKVFINACKLTGEMPIDWAFFLAVWHSVNSLSVSLTDWNLYWSSIHLVSNKSLSLRRQQNSCHDASLIFLFFSSWSIWRMITCSLLTKSC